MKHAARQTKHSNGRSRAHPRIHHRAHSRLHQPAKNATHFIDNLVNRSSEVFNQAEAQVDAMKDKAHDYRMSVEHYIEDNPVKALGIAAAVGVLCALIWRR